MCAVWQRRSPGRKAEKRECEKHTSVNKDKRERENATHQVTQYTKIQRCVLAVESRSRTPGAVQLQACRCSCAAHSMHGRDLCALCLWHRTLEQVHLHFRPDSVTCLETCQRACACSGMLHPSQSRGASAHTIAARRTSTVS